MRPGEKHVGLNAQRTVAGRSWRRSASASGEPDDRRRFSENVAWSMGGTLGVTLAGLSANVILARVLPPRTFGTYAVLITSVSVLTVLGRLGTDVAVVSSLSRARGAGQLGAVRRALRHLVVIGVSGSAVVAGGWIVLSIVLKRASLQSPELAALAPWVAAWIFLEAVAYLFAEAQRGLGDIRRAATLGDPLRRILLLVGFVAMCFMSTHPSLRSLLMVTVVATGVAAVVSAGAIWRATRLLPSGPAVLQTHPLATAWPFVLVNASALIATQGGVWILGALAPAREVAAFGAAVRLVTLLALPLFVLNAVLAPELARTHATGRLASLEPRMRISVTAATMAAAVGTAAIALFGGRIFALVLGDFYRQSAVLFVILSFGQLVNIASGTCGTALGMAGHQRLVAFVDVAGAAAFVALAVAGERLDGAVGVAVASGVACACRNGLLGFLAWRRLGVRTYAYFNPRDAATAYSSIARGRAAGTANAA